MSFAVKSTVFRLSVFQKIFIQNTAIRNYPAVRKRFYKTVHVSESDGKFEVCLDKRKLKTPLGKLLQLPNEALAVAVATEWDLQKDTLQQNNMHITALCNTAIDNPSGHNTEGIVDSMLQYLSSDTICFRSDDPPEFVQLQKDMWDPLVRWFENRYQVEIEVSEDIGFNPVSDTTLVKIRKHMLSYSQWCLIGLNFATENLKSLIITLALVNHVIDVEKAVALSRLETNFQVKSWGAVEWAHDVDEAQLKTRVAAAALFTYLNEGSSDFVVKNTSKKVKISNKG